MNCDKLLQLFLETNPSKVEDVDYFKCKHLLEMMEKHHCNIPITNEIFRTKVLLLRKLAREGRQQPLTQNEENNLIMAAIKAKNRAVSELNSELNGGSRRASKHSKKSRKSRKHLKMKSRKTKSRRH